MCAGSLPPVAPAIIHCYQSSPCINISIAGWRSSNIYLLHPHCFHSCRPQVQDSKPSTISAQWPQRCHQRYRPPLSPQVGNGEKCQIRWTSQEFQGERGTWRGTLLLVSPQADLHWSLITLDQVHPVLDLHQAQSPACAFAISVLD